QNKITNKVGKLSPYVPSPTLSQLSQGTGYKVQDIIKLTTGENEFLDSNFTRYPDPYGSDLIREIAKYTNLETSWITIGNGSDELIDLICAVFLDPGDSVLDCTPTFPMYQFFARIRNARVVSIPRTPTFGIDVEEIKRKSADINLIF